MPPRHLLAALLTTRRGVVLLALSIGAVYLVALRPASPALEPAGSSSTSRTDTHTGGYGAYVPQKLREGWSSWRSGGLSDPESGAGAGAGAMGNRQGSQAALLEAQLREEKNKVWYAAPGAGKDDDDDDERDFSSSPKTTADDDMFLSPEEEEAGHAGLVQQEQEEREREGQRVDPVAAAERRPEKGRPDKDKYGGLLSPDELDSLDAAAEEERLASSAHSSHRTSPSSNSENDDDFPLPDSDFPPAADSASSPLNDDDDLDVESEGGDASSDFSPEEAAEADAPSIAAKEDARLRAPMAALSGGKPSSDEEEYGEEGQEEEVPREKKVKPATVHKGEKVAPLAAAGAAGAANPPAEPLINGGKKVGTGGKLLAGAGAGGGGAQDGGGVPAVKGQGRGSGSGRQRMRPKPNVKAEGVVKEEAGRRVGTGARPGAKGLGGRMRRVVRRGRRLEEEGR
ncbi:hypothetical protein JCM6882_000983 [Rhodosporidiobolus microsporus]